MIAVRRMMAGLLAFAPLVAVATDFAHVSQRETWLAHPVYGEASFDAFERRPGNPVLRGAAPHDWPVNGFLFEDPASGNWYSYIGHYGRGYTAEVPMRCTVSRSTDGGATWENLGAIFPDAPHTFEGEQAPVGHAPDVSVAYADGRYHLVYDWLTESTKWGDIFNPDATHNSGVGYAWAERPEGPFHRSTKPIWTTRDQPALLGKYRRQYASTLIRRAGDWLLLTLTDSGPNFGWAYLGRTAASPEGPWSEAMVLLHPERETYHPPLLEFHPAFVHGGFVYAPATSVALNRNVQALFRALVEKAADPNAWELKQLGSLWHAEPVEHEFDGLWGQTFSGFVGKDGEFNVLFPSRDPDGFGTINIAHRPWDRPFNDQGFVVSAHQGPSVALLKRGGTPAGIEAKLSLQGTVSIFWGAEFPLGPNEARSDASLHPLMKTRRQALELRKGHWRLVVLDETGAADTIAEGAHSTPGAVALSIQWPEPGQCALSVDGDSAWEGVFPATEGAFGLYLEPNSHARVATFRIDGALAPSTRRYLWTEGVLGAAQQMKNWEAVANNPNFSFGVGAIGNGEPAAAKWSVEGNRIVIHAPRGPGFGRAKVLLDGREVGEIDYHAEAPERSAPVFEISLDEGRHGVRLESIEGRMPLDLLEVSGG